MPDPDPRPPLPTSLWAFAMGMPDMASPYAAEPDYGYGFRYHSRDPKGLGFLGPLKPADPRYGVMGEFSLGVDVNGQEMEIPSLVPTLTRDEVQQVVAMRAGDRMPRAIIQKAIAHAQARLAAGLPVFARTGEQQNLYPDLERVPVPEARPQAPPVIPTLLPGGVPLSSLGQPPPSEPR